MVLNKALLIEKQVVLWFGDLPSDKLKVMANRASITSAVQMANRALAQSIGTIHVVKAHMK